MLSSLESLRPPLSAVWRNPFLQFDRFSSARSTPLSHPPPPMARAAIESKAGGNIVCLTFCGGPAQNRPNSPEMGARSQIKAEGRGQGGHRLWGGTSPGCPFQCCAPWVSGPRAHEWSGIARLPESAGAGGGRQGGQDSDGRRGKGEPPFPSQGRPSGMRAEEASGMA